VDNYAIARVTEDIGETSNTRVKQAIEGFMVSSFYNLAIGQEDQATGYALLAEKVWAWFQRKVSTSKEQAIRVELPPLDDLKRESLKLFEETHHRQLMDQLRTKLGLPPSTNAPPAASPANPSGNP